MVDLTRLSTTQDDFWARLDSLLAWEEGADERVDTIVRTILDEVKREGDAAVVRHTNHLDRRDAATMAELELTPARLQEALRAIPSEQRWALESAASRIRAYHEHQKQGSWDYTESDGTRLGQQVTPLDRVGLYVPGGKAAYPSSVLMNAVPAKVAGVSELVMVVPAPDGELNDLVLAAAAVAEVDRVITIGGAQAVAALAYGTETIAQVDKIVGPGNIYVATAKRMVFGTVGIDMIAGPSEILVIGDGHTEPDWVAMDLFSQAEHDEDAQSILVCPDGDYLDRVAMSMERLLAEMPRAEVIRTSLARRGALIQCRNLDEAVTIANHIAPEHLELSVAEAEELVPRIRHAGAIFIGRYTSESIGDYCAGPNHVLPTSRTARFSSPLGVYDFQKRSSLIQCTAAGAADLGHTAAALADGEGLAAHAAAARLRMTDGGERNNG